jgi:hypothetical protein
MWITIRALCREEKRKGRGTRQLTVNLANDGINVACGLINLESLK